MAELPEFYRPSAERTGLVEVGKLPVRVVVDAIKSSLSTMDAVMRLFDALMERLGPRGYDDPSALTPARRLHLRDREDPSWLVPQPLLEIRPVAHRRQKTMALLRTGPDLPSEAQPDDWKRGDPPWAPSLPLPELVPAGPTMFAGDFLIREGSASLEIRYDDRGVWCGCTWTGGDAFWAVRAPDRLPFMIDTMARGGDSRPLALACRDDLHIGMTAEQLAAMLLETVQPERVRIRVRVPVPVPAGPDGVRISAITGLRRGVGEGAPAGARVCVADGFVGTAISFGATIEEAMTRWTEAVWRHKPGHDVAAPPPVKVHESTETDDEPVTGADEVDNVRAFRLAAHRIDLGTFRLAIPPPPSAVSVPAYVPDNTPAVRVDLPEAWPSVPEVFARAGFTRWIRLVSEFGGIGHALVREEADRVTLVGEGVLDLVDPDTLGDVMEEAVRCTVEELATDLRDRYPDEPGLLREVAEQNWYRFQVWDPNRRSSVFRVAASTSVDRLPFDEGDALPWTVACWFRRRGRAQG